MVNSKSGEDYKNLLKISLQFFGEDGDGGDDDDFDGDFFDDNDTDYYGSDDEDAEEDGDTDEGGADGGDPAEDADEEDGADGSDADEDDPAEEAGEEDPSSPADAGASPPGEAEVDLIAELRALGFVGNDIASLTADMKQKREAKAAEDAKAKKAADKADGKAHVRSGAPSRSASGDGTGGISERQVVAFAERTGCSKEEARRVLAKHARLMA